MAFLTKKTPSGFSAKLEGRAFLGEKLEVVVFNRNDHSEAASICPWPWQVSEELPEVTRAQLRRLQVEPNLAQPVQFYNIILQSQRGYSISLRIILV